MLTSWKLGEDKATIYPTMNPNIHLSTFTILKQNPGAFSDKWIFENTFFI